jgi:hypothetical protein
MSLIFPTGRVCKPDKRLNVSRISVMAGRRFRSSSSPACVGETLRVVRESNRIPTCSSSRFIAWLSQEVEMFSRFEARVKLRSSATTMNADKTFNSSPTIV